MTKGYYPDTRLKEIDQSINQQISHLQYDRPAFTKDQLNFNNMFRVRGAIQREVEKFQKKIVRDSEFWKLREERKDIDQQVWLKFVSSQPTATNVIDVIGPVTVTL
jgi:hypothetical protein